MKIVLRAAGRLRSGPEREMVDDYIGRANLLARRTGYLSVTEDAVDMRSSKTRTEETEKLLAGIADGAKIIILDERGQTPTSRKMAQNLENAKQTGFPALYFLIGAADGFEPSALPKGLTRWALGPQTWPHQLVRVMIAEQIYRALSIQAGTPYHRD